MSTNKITIKLIFNGVIHKATLTLPTCLITIREKAVTSFKDILPQRWILEYEDSDHEMIMLSEEEDLANMIEELQKNSSGTLTSRITIKEDQEDTQLQIKQKQSTDTAIKPKELKDDNDYERILAEIDQLPDKCEKILDFTFQAPVEKEVKVEKPLREVTRGPNRPKDIYVPRAEREEQEVGQKNHEESKQDNINLNSKELINQGRGNRYLDLNSERKGSNRTLSNNGGCVPREKSSNRNDKPNKNGDIYLAYQKSKNSENPDKGIQPHYNQDQKFQNNGKFINRNGIFSNSEHIPQTVIANNQDQLRYGRKSSVEKNDIVFSFDQVSITKPFGVFTNQSKSPIRTTNQQAYIPKSKPHDVYNNKSKSPIRSNIQQHINQEDSYNLRPNHQQQGRNKMVTAPKPQNGTNLMFESFAPINNVSDQMRLKKIENEKQERNKVEKEVEEKRRALERESQEYSTVVRMKADEILKIIAADRGMLLKFIKSQSESMTLEELINSFWDM